MLDLKFVRVVKDLCLYIKSEKLESDFDFAYYTFIFVK